jgi:hypothetical protein
MNVSSFGKDHYMFLDLISTRRRAMKAGIASLAAGVTAAKESYAALRPKASGETKIVYLGGDQLHNGFGQEYYLRRTLRQVDWRIMCTTDARFVTPELIADADLLMITRWLGPIPVWKPEPVVETRDGLDGFMSDELAEAIVDNVTNRGMGFMALHATVTCANKPIIGKLMGVEAKAHGPFQNIRVHDLNMDHPITNHLQGWRHIEGERFWVRELTDEIVTEYPLLDENFGAVPNDDRVTVLTKSTGEKDGVEKISGWCVEQGKGRVVGLCAGHSSDQFLDTIHRQVCFRAIHWAMKRDIPAYKGKLDPTTID